MTPEPHGPVPDPEELDALLRLLDDDTPEVRSVVADRLSKYSGDISEFLASRSSALTSKEKDILTHILATQRRVIIENEWQVPSGGAGALREDWELFEALLRNLSDFLHDGITFRQPLSDALDLLAEEATHHGVADPAQLAQFLFVHGPLRGNKEAYDDPRNADLAWCMAEGRSNPIGLCVIYILVARRMDLPVEAVNFPGHFLCRIHLDGRPVLVDCYQRGTLHLQDEILEKPELSRAAKQVLKQAADPGTILIRMLNNLQAALLKAQRKEDAQLTRRLRLSLD